MAESIYPYALTSLQRVKDRLGLSVSNFDAVLTRMINSMTDYFERETGNRRFVLTKYSNEIYSSQGRGQLRVVLRQAPVFFLTTTGDLTAGSNVIANVGDTTGMVAGIPIAADNLITTYQDGNGNTLRNAVASVNGASVTMQAAAKKSETGAILQANGILLFQWRPGTPATDPSWFNFIPDQYQLVNDGKAGIIRVYGFVPMTQDNMLRITYWAGYAVDWSNAGNNTTHRLPADITDVVENVVVRRFKRRDYAGKTSEGLEGATTSWNKELDREDLDVIGHYMRVPTIF